MSILFAQTGGSSASGIAAFLPIILIGLIFYFLILRPQNKERAAHEKQLSDLKKGDKIITRGGLNGRIINFEGKNNIKVIIDIGSGVKATVTRSYIAGIDSK
tara:strand:- start:1017 stop:1322 length:306 start_codon:yes stop_codon:yes gene_type:complete